MADQNPSSLLHVDVNDFPKDQGRPVSEHRAIWHPFDHMNGHVVVKSPSAIDIEKISVHLEGITPNRHSKVWIQGLTEEDQMLISTSSYKFLHQSHDATIVERLQDPAFAGFTYLASFHLAIPRWAILNTENVPDQCLSLPPSLSAGVPYRRPGEEDEYAQPNIHYRLKARVNLNFLQDSILPRTLEASRTIVILPCSPPMPPTDTSDFPAEFISSASNTYRAFLFGSWYTMTLSMQEPAAISLQGTQTRGSVHAMLHVEIRAPASVMDSTSAKRLPPNLKNLLFKIQPILRAKTFYSTKPFRKMPGQTMLTLKGPVRLKDEVMKLDAHDLKASSWQHDIPDEAPWLAEVDRRSSTSTRSASVSTIESTDGCKASPMAEGSPWAWSTRLSVPITVQPNLPPTFCSVTASRQYSLIMRIRVVGVSIKDFVLEVPLQILYTPRESQERRSTFSTYELQPSFTSTSRLDEVLQETDHPDEDLPDYL